MPKRKRVARKSKVHNYKEVFLIEVPEHTHKRYKWVGDRTVLIDMRGIYRPVGGNPDRAYKRRFKSPEHLKALCDEYFASCEGVIYNPKTGKPYEDSNGYPVTGQVKPYTVSGLALFLGLETKTLLKYESGMMDSIGFSDYEQLEYSKVMRQAKQRIEEYAEAGLYNKDSFNGSRFVLGCGFKWWVTQKELAEIEHIRAATDIRRKEYKLKKKALIGDDSEPVTITITRANKEA